MTERPVVLVRPVPQSFDRCIRETPCAIDVDLARRQHRAYVYAIHDAGCEVEFLPTLDAAPDSVFVEDPVVVLDRHAVLTCTGAPARRSEGESIAAFLGAFELVVMREPATLDGGDVLRIGRHVFVGITHRTNRAGFDFLAQIAEREGLAPVAIPMASGLHLKSFCSALGESVIGLFDRVDRAVFAALGFETVDAPEPAGANLLDLGSSVLVSSAAPKTAERIGARARLIDVSEFHKGDGALTCLSIRLGRPQLAEA